MVYLSVGLPFVTVVITDEIMYNFGSKIFTPKKKLELGDSSGKREKGSL